MTLNSYNTSTFYTILTAYVKNDYRPYYSILTLFRAHSIFIKISIGTYNVINRARD